MSDEASRVRKLIAEYHKANAAVRSLPPAPETPTRESRQQRYDATSALSLAEERAAKALGVEPNELRAGADVGVWRKGPSRSKHLPQPNGKPRWGPGGDVPFPTIKRHARHGDNET